VCGIRSRDAMISRARAEARAGRSCERCGAEIVRSLSTARFCTETCRKREAEKRRRARSRVSSPG
jgi:hypothetical protein